MFFVVFRHVEIIWIRSSSIYTSRNNGCGVSLWRATDFFSFSPLVLAHLMSNAVKTPKAGLLRIAVAILSFSITCFWKKKERRRISWKRLQVTLEKWEITPPWTMLHHHTWIFNISFFWSSVMNALDVHGCQRGTGGSLSCCVTSGAKCWWISVVFMHRKKKTSQSTAFHQVCFWSPPSLSRHPSVMGRP